MDDEDDSVDGPREVDECPVCNSEQERSHDIGWIFNCQFCPVQLQWRKDEDGTVYLDISPHEAAKQEALCNNRNVEEITQADIDALDKIPRRFG